MKCTKCGTDNFDVAVSCARCAAPLSNSNPVFRSNPDPEPPTQISGVGMERVRFGPAPESPKTPKPMRVRRPPPHQEQPNVRTHDDREENLYFTPQSQNVQDYINNEEPSIMMFGVLAFSLGVSFLFLCVDFYALFLILKTSS